MRVFSPALEEDDGMAASSDAAFRAEGPEPETLARRISALVEGAAIHLGMSEPAAQHAGQTAALRSGDKRIDFRPLGTTMDGGLSLALTLDTTIPVQCDDGRAHWRVVLRQAPSAMWAFSTAFGATEDGCWRMLRKVSVGPQGASVLAARVVETLQLAEYLLQDAPRIEH